MDISVIEKEAVQLTETDRALLADRLLYSLSSTDDATHAKWASESQDRLDAFHRGEMEAIDRPSAIKQLKARFPK